MIHQRRSPQRALPWWLVLLCSFLCTISVSWSQQAVPALTGHVVDISGTLDAPQRRALEAKLVEFERLKGSQVVVLLVLSIQPEEIAAFANRVANQWKIGRKDIGDGLLLVVAVQDRKVRIEVSKTLEGAVPDLAAKRVIEEAIKPRFKQADYAGGIEAGLNQLFGLISGEQLPEPVALPSAAETSFDWMQLGVFMLIAVPVVGAVTRQILGIKLGALATGGVAGGIVMTLTASVWLSGLAGLLALFFTLLQTSPFNRGRVSTHWGGGSFSGGLGGGGAGGGFSSGGGGDFGGGGASGDW